MSLRQQMMLLIFPQSANHGKAVSKQLLNPHILVLHLLVRLALHIQYSFYLLCLSQVAYLNGVC